MTLASLSPRDRRALSIAGWILIPSLLYVFAVKPYFGSLATIKEQIEDEQSMLEREQNLAKRLPTLPEEKVRVSNELRQEASRLFVGEDELVATGHLAEYIADLADEYNVNLIQSETRNGAAVAPGVRSVQVEVRAEGEVYAVMHFLERLESGDKLVRLSNLVLEKSSRSAMPQPQQMAQTGGLTPVQYNQALQRQQQMMRNQQGNNWNRNRGNTSGSRSQRSGSGNRGGTSSGSQQPIRLPITSLNNMVSGGGVNVSFGDGGGSSSSPRVVSGTSGQIGGIPGLSIVRAPDGSRSLSYGGQTVPVGPAPTRPPVQYSGGVVTGGVAPQQNMGSMQGRNPYARPGGSMPVMNPNQPPPPVDILSMTATVHGYRLEGVPFNMDEVDPAGGPSPFARERFTLASMDQVIDRNPFDPNRRAPNTARHVSTGGPEQPALRLTGTGISDNYSFALITSMMETRSQMVPVGGYIFGYRLNDVTAETAVLTTPTGGTLVLRVSPPGTYAMSGPARTANGMPANIAQPTLLSNMDPASQEKLKDAIAEAMKRAMSGADGGSLPDTAVVMEFKLNDLLKPVPSDQESRPSEPSPPPSPSPARGESTSESGSSSSAQSVPSKVSQQQSPSVKQ